MGLKSKALIGLMALCLLGGVGSAAALVVNGAQNQNIANNGAVESAIYLHFDDVNSSTAQLENLGVASQYRYVKVLAPSKTTSVTGNYQVNFELRPTAPNGVTYTLAGVTCKIYRGLNSGTYVSAHDATQLNPASVATNTLVGGDAAVNQSYDVSVANGEEFYLEFNYVKDGGNSNTLGGSLIVSLNKA